ncbi:Outer row dynein assembly protein 16 [Tetrabaena socialis]|uniref:Outer row dynein assembly protein 16 n=1 Tax=Tetrabaena socialis TaxID=47790 RepID=A0A2J8ACK9_9CHLO|nr:Outer row dynein assembly protein 16 [Tetrabaena socialis]|eukprot:PNH10255.1 Outer row dynein assembly protein 16 [Tetrabaena socialis]
MFSDDEEAEIAVDIRRVYAARVPPCSLGQKEPIKPLLQSARNKDPSVVSSHYDPAKKRLFFGLDNGAVCFWPLTESEPNSSRFVGAHGGPVTAICIPRRSDGDLGKSGLIVTGAVDSSIKIWDYQGKVILNPTVCVQTLYGHSGTVTSLVILGDYIVSSSTDGSIKMWRQEEGRGQLVYPWFELQATVTGMDGWVRCMTYDSSNDVGELGAIFAADESGSVTKLMPEALWDDSIQRLSTRMEFKVVHRVERLHDRGISTIRFVAKWDLLLTVAFDNCIRAYDVRTSSVRHCWVNERQCQFTALEVNTEFDEVLAGDAQGVLSIYSVLTGRLMVTKLLTQQPSGAGGAPRRGATPGGGASSVLSITAVLGRQLYAVMTAHDLGLWQIEHELDYNVARGGHEKAVISLYSCSGGVAGPSGDHDYRIFSASLDNTMRLWDPYDMACIRVMDEVKSEVSAMTFYEGWNILVTGHDNGDIRLWNLDTSNTVTLRQHNNTVTSLTLALVHRNEELLISSSYDGWVILWDIRSLRGEEPHMVAKFRAHGLEAARAAMSGSGVAGEGAASQRPSATGATVSHGSATMTATPAITTTTVSAVPPGSAGAAGASGEAPRAALTFPEPEILALRFDPLKKAIVTAGTDKVIKVWAAAGYDFLGSHSGHKDAVTCLALDSNFLFSGSDDCTICLWDTVPAGGQKTHYAGARLTAVGAGLSGAGSGPPPAPASLTLKAPFSSRPLKVLSGHRKSVTGLDVLPSSGNLVSCSLDGQLLVWDYVAGQVLHRFAHDTEAFRCLALRYDRPEVLVGTMQASLLRYAVHESAVAVPGLSRKGPSRPDGTVAAVQEAVEALSLAGGAEDSDR